ncbi:MAG: hypothetical protein U1F09_16335 [Steroidobacteraceae bacterium]
MHHAKMVARDSARIRPAAATSLASRPRTRRRARRAVGREEIRLDRVPAVHVRGEERAVARAARHLLREELSSTTASLPTCGCR